MAEVQVIIPVYNAFAESRACLLSVMQFSPEATRILVIDDLSPEGNFADYINDLPLDPRVQLIRNPVNLGFTGSCNLGMRLAGQADVILLNSDTEVSARWISKMRNAAYSAADVGTVTPLTNNGVICSVPRFCQNNHIPGALPLEQFANLVERVAVKDYQSLPTCMGFCVYIKREVLNQTGGFDEEAFGRGYGEENDLSLRAQALGYRDIVDDSTFIFHKGNCSFLGLQASLSEKNGAIIKQRYPHYFDRVSRFCSQNPLRSIQLRIQDELVNVWNQSRPRILHVVHNGPHVPRRDPLGGTEMHVQDLISEVKECAHWSLVPDKLCYYLTAHFPGGEREYILDLGKTSLKKIFSPEYFDIVHLHHSRWLDHHELTDALCEFGQHIVSFHDYMLVCPRFHLYTPFRQVCTGVECASQCGYRMEYINDLRERTSKLLNSAQQVLYFSQSTRDTIKKILGTTGKEKICAHGIYGYADEVPQPVERSWSSKEPFRICFLGYVPQHKGSLVIEELIKNCELAGQAVEWHVIGKLFFDAGDRVIQHGEYNRTELKAKIEKANPHLVMILSICPETYCLTLDEAWNAGVPVVVSPYGAPPERVRATGAGWIVDRVELATVRELLEKILSNPADYKQKSASIANVKLTSIAKLGREYSGIYSELLQHSPRSSLVALFSYLREFGLARAPKVSLLYRITGRLTSYAIYTLDSLRIRDHFQKWAYRLLPRRFITILKSAR